MTLSLPRLSHKRMAALVHDLVMTAVAIVVCYVARFGLDAFNQRLDEMALLAALVLPVAAIVYQRFGLYTAVWRFASVPDLLAILKAVTTLAALMAVLDFATRGDIMVPRSIAFLFWFVGAALLGGPRLAFRSYRDQHLKKYGREVASLRMPTLVLGAGRDAEVLIRSLETDPTARLRPVGILGHKATHVGQRIRGIPILGTGADVAEVAGRLQARSPAPLRLVVTDEALRDHERCEQAIAAARELGMPVDRMSPIGETEHAAGRARLREIDIADLRTRGDVDPRPLAELVQGRDIVVTGGGGILGGEICRQVARAGCRRLLVVENAELALYDCGRTLAAAFPDLDLTTSLQDVRDERAMEEIFRDFRPAVVFHAAAMKNEATIARQLRAALSVNLGGTVSVAKAAIASGAESFVHISTERAARVDSAMGATQRLAELYLRLVDASDGGEAGRAPALPTRFVSIRFGHVYSSRGATVAALRSQIARGGPVLVSEDQEAGLVLSLEDAVARVLHTGSTALARGDTSLLSIDLGTPIELKEMARRMIRLAGLRPDIDVAVVSRPAAAALAGTVEFRGRVAALSARADSDPHFVLREILSIAQRDGPDGGIDMPVATLEYLSPSSRREMSGGRLH